MADADGSSSDESLDITSDKFDPLKALYTPKLLLTNLTAPLYDNVSKFESVMSGMSGKSKKKNVAADVGQGESSRQRFLPHQGLHQERERHKGTRGGIRGRLRQALEPRARGLLRGLDPQSQEESACPRPSATTAADESAPKVVVTKIEGKRETLERHVPQMLLRGEHVAIIVKTN
ncbi:U6 snRNA-associated Sm-like protein LSm11 isoform X4 [Megalopta genalis]|uniref:U6 snRNA-associated Sm-like protein LSm11 isoform X4 n=1 Tax=Megalopta genalis TaxID=115081 RepID=UPI003FD04C03